jgi:acyl carrier protein
MNDLGLDSLDQVEIIMAVEDEFSVYIVLQLVVCLCTTWIIK